MRQIYPEAVPNTSGNLCFFRRKAGCLCMVNSCNSRQGRNKIEQQYSYKNPPGYSCIIVQSGCMALPGRRLFSSRDRAAAAVAPRRTRGRPSASSGVLVDSRDSGRYKVAHGQADLKLHFVPSVFSLLIVDVFVGHWMSQTDAFASYSPLCHTSVRPSVRPSVRSSVCSSVQRTVRPSVGLFVRPSVSKTLKTCDTSCSHSTSV